MFFDLLNHDCQLSVDQCQQCVGHGLETHQPHGVVLAFHQLLYLIDTALDALGILQLQTRKRQHHQALGVVELGRQPQQGGAVERTGSLGKVTLVVGQHAVALQPLDGGRCDVAGPARSFHGQCGFALVQVQAHQHVVGVGKRRLFFCQQLQSVQGIVGFACFQL